MGCRRGEYPGRGRATQCIAAARGAVESNVIVYARRNHRLARLPPRWGGHGGTGGAVCNNKPNRSQRTTKTSIPRRSISLQLSSLQVRLPSGRAETTSVIDTIIRRATRRAAFRYLSIQIQTIQSCTQPRNPIATAGATLIGARTPPKTCCALHFRFAMLAVLKYSCASQPKLLPLATVF